MTDTPIAGPQGGGTPPAASAVVPFQSDVPQPVPTPVSARVRDEMDDARLASARAAWVAAGHDPKVFDAHYSDQPAPAAHPDADPNNPLHRGPSWQDQQGAPQGQGDTVILPQISSDMAHIMAEQLVARGLDDDAVAAEMAKLGYVADDRSDEQRAWDQQHYLDDARAPGDYRLDLSAMHLLEHDPAEVAAAQEAWGGFFAGMAIPPEIGVGLAEHISRTSHQVNVRPEFERQLWAQDQAYQLRQHCGSDEAVKALKQDAGLAIKYAIDMAPSKISAMAVVKGMDEAGAFSDAHVLRTLANWGANLSRWMEGIND